MRKPTAISYLEGQPEGLVGRPAGGHDGVEGLEQGHAAGLALLPLDGPALGGGEIENLATSEQI